MKNNSTGIWAVYDAYKAGNYKVNESLYYGNGTHFTAISTTKGPWAVIDALEYCATSTTADITMKPYTRRNAAKL